LVASVTREEPAFLTEVIEMVASRKLLVTGGIAANRKLSRLPRRGSQNAHSGKARNVFSFFLVIGYNKKRGA
jgi:tRNA A37 threonylcarbamoyltransferase TsaD